jgi:hypothetical protein
VDAHAVSKDSDPAAQSESKARNFIIFSQPMFDTQTSPDPKRFSVKTPKNVTDQPSVGKGDHVTRTPQITIWLA